ncbi:MAG: ribosomal protein L19, large subunit ribosomal protein L19 [Candidatus Peregrinibacteria bacterium GW2011_GWF2_33_10]|nr:MAG: ribosomal protein L19, large subunit ribosomal protein L19 [Candidatus Peregrinibacteria bacterium GW2011_GWF2_33_10]OGJ45406.1 MAG: 50S ribosomal protein L19 [Candidatus Peregrinibacteria bacterium RIFOXYA2_FULL_33_21]OGJ45527.1 MAG: 50S ribosomal protein L19 [Candidatus Peregrinibacteria bacterium RIFOXYA12_FULL_33_12]OGJ51009.1 MAG: 50S ribosomal protein L19 [Candidatus Peregrinibacteria bacterium RIFOXYB2_FULL_33_20]
MSQAILHDVAQKSKPSKSPLIKPGYTIKVYQKIIEGDKQRTQIFEGIVLKMNAGYGADSTVTIRKVVDGIGVERIFPLYGPMIDKIQIIKKGNVRRSKLYYLRNKSGKAAKLKEIWMPEEREILSEGVKVSTEAATEKSVDTTSQEVQDKSEESKTTETVKIEESK